jgi:KaiC/GvpD/RAD55 family RecA-like ATPase
MLHPEFKYIGTKEELRSETAIVPVGELPSEHQGERYATIYRFDEGIKKYSSVADLGDDVRLYADYLVFDFDDKNSLEGPFQDTVALCQALKAMGAGYETYFSGFKGFHVLVPTSQFAFEPTTDEGVLKRMATIIASRFKTFDPTIYNKTRVLRLPGSLNKKTGLRKIPIPAIENQDIQSILDNAATVIENPYPDPWDYNKVTALCNLYEQCKHKINRTIQATEPKESYGDWGLIKENVQTNYNSTLYGMARDLARHGIFERDALIIFNWWNKSHTDPMDGKELAKTVKSAYSKGVNQLVVEDNVFNFAYNSKKALDAVRQVYQNWSQNIVKTGFDFFDEFTLGFFKEEVIFIIARPGNFKTCFLSNMLYGVSKNTNRPCIFFSQEQSVEALTIRHMQKAEHKTQLEILKAIKGMEDFPVFESEFKNVFVVGLSSLNTDKVLNIIDKFLEEYGPLGAVGFDYLSLFEGCANDTARTARMATELKTRVAKAAGCPTFCLVQAKREYQGEEGNIEIDLTAGKDSSSIEDSGDYVIGIWGHWETRPAIDIQSGQVVGDTREKKLYGRFLKARKFMSEKYNDLPYFQINLDKAYMDVKNIVYRSNPPQFKQKENQYGRD